MASQAKTQIQRGAQVAAALIKERDDLKAKVEKLCGVEIRSSLEISCLKKQIQNEQSARSAVARISEIVDEVFPKKEEEPA